MRWLLRIPLFFSSIESSTVVHFYTGDISFNGKKCSTNLAFGEIEARSRLECANICKRFETCVSMFYSADTSRCVGCGSFMSASSNLEPLVGSLYYIILGADSGHYIGCYADNYPRAMEKHAHLSASMTVELCSSFCREYGSLYFGLQHYDECFCDNTYDKYGPSNGCTTPCAGDSSQICGGSFALSVYIISYV